MASYNEQISVIFTRYLKFTRPTMPCGLGMQYSVCSIQYSIFFEIAIFFILLLTWIMIFYILINYKHFIVCEMLSALAFEVSFLFGVACAFSIIKNSTVLFTNWLNNSIKWYFVPPLSSLYLHLWPSMTWQVNYISADLYKIEHIPYMKGKA